MRHFNKKMSLIKCYWMLQKARVKAFIVFELSRVKQQRGAGGLKLPPPLRLGLIVTFSNSEHQDFFPSTGKPVNGSLSTSVRDYMFICDHKVVHEDFRFLL